MSADAVFRFDRAAPAPSSVSAALVVEHQPLRRQIEEILCGNDIDCVALADSPEGLPTPSRSNAFDVIVARAGETATRILDGFKAVRARFPTTPIVGLWPDGVRREHERALKAGVDGLVNESQVPVALGPTIAAVCSGLVCFPGRNTPPDRGESLSARERQVLGMLIMGFTNAEIGRRLFLAESTVKSHLSSAYMKLGVRSRKDAAALILDPDEGLGTGILALAGD
jgi:DNA-binding NarL/FixJ family response regulator